MNDKLTLSDSLEKIKIEDREHYNDTTFIHNLNGAFRKVNIEDPKRLNYNGSSGSSANTKAEHHKHSNVGNNNAFQNVNFGNYGNLTWYNPNNKTTWNENPNGSQTFPSGDHLHKKPKLFSKQRTGNVQNEFTHGQETKNFAYFPNKNYSLDIPVPERERLYAEVFDQDRFLFDKIINKFLPKKNQQHCTVRLSPSYNKDTLLKVCEAFDLELFNSGDGNVRFKKIITDKRSEEQGRIKHARALLREERKKFYGAAYLKEHGITHLGYDYETIMNEVKYLRRCQGKAVEEIPLFFKEKKKRPTKTGSAELDETFTASAPALPIASDNKGHRMLQAMGWKEGDKLGINGGGLIEPISTFMRPKNRGLGA